MKRISALRAVFPALAPAEPFSAAFAALAAGAAPATAAFVADASALPAVSWHHCSALLFFDLLCPAAAGVFVDLSAAGHIVCPVAADTFCPAWRRPCLEQPAVPPLEGRERGPGRIESHSPRAAELIRFLAADFRHGWLAVYSGRRLRWPSPRRYP